MKAVWGGAIIAESPVTITIEDHEYFPPDTVHREYLVSSETPYTCPWKGVCTNYSLMVEGQELKDGAFTYEHPKDGSIEKVGQDFTNYVGFWRGVEVSE